MTRSRLAATLALALALVLPVGTAVADTTADTPDDDSIRAIIGFADGPPADVELLVAAADLDLVHISPQGGWIAVEADSPQKLDAARLTLPGVVYVEPDETLYALVVPDDTRYSSQYGPPMMGAHAAWDTAGFGDDSVVVAVLDTGLLHGHEDLTPPSRFPPTEVYTGNANDNCGHGTHVTGTVAATTNNALGVAGMAQARILTYKVLDAIAGLINLTCAGSTSSIAQAVYDATDAGADVISMSLGGGGFSNAFNDAVNYAWANGVLVVAASGNDGADDGVSYPAAYDNAIAVGALTSSKTRASYSNGGPELEVMAPGSNVLSTYTGSTSSYTSLSGTSMATPHVSGALALALSCAPAGTTNAEVRQELRDTAEDLGPAGFDDAHGYGLARVDLLVGAVCDGSQPDPEPDPDNTAPVAAFTTSTDGLTVSVDGSSSSDADGDALAYAWNFGDGSTASGVTASHTYASGGTYTVTLTVDDSRGGSDSATAQVTVDAGGDPDPSTPTLSSGEPVTVTLDGTGDEEFYKVAVPSGTSSLAVSISGPNCGLLSCPLDADLYTRHGARPTNSEWDCRPYLSGNNESCSHSSPPTGYTYIRVHSYSGSGEVTLTATVS